MARGRQVPPAICQQLRHGATCAHAQAPMPALRCLLMTFVLGAGLPMTGCTVAKPLVGAVTGPIVLLAASNGSFCSCGDGRAVLYLFVFMAAVGAGGGLVTGIISDVQVLTGAADDPCHNWWEPFRTNTMP